MPGMHHITIVRVAGGSYNVDDSQLADAIDQPVARRTPAPEAMQRGQGGMAMPIEVLLLDVGGVLIPPPDLSLVRDLEAELALPPDSLERLLYECQPWYAISTGRLDEPAYWRAIAEAVDREPAALQRLLRPLWIRDRVDEAVVDLVRAVGVRKAILSNATLHLEEVLRDMAIDHLFDPIINSARIGLRKPDPLLFQRAVEILGVSPQAILFVDDKERNTRVAEELGIASVRFEGAASLAVALRRAGLLQ